jgi:hypothetical protein
MNQINEELDRLDKEIQDKERRLGDRRSEITTLRARLRDITKKSTRLQNYPKAVALRFYMRRIIEERRKISFKFITIRRKKLRLLLRVFANFKILEK